MIRDANIILIAGIDWAFNWQLPQEVACAFAEAGNRILFIENTGVRRPELKDLGRLRARLGMWRAARGQAQTIRGGVDLYSPVLVPFPYSPLAVRLNTIVMMRTIRRWMSGERHRPLIVITFLPTPLARAVIRALDPALIVYYSADRLSESSPGARGLRDPERALLAEAHLVLTTSEGWRKSAEEIATRVELLACGVRFHEFERSRLRASPAPPLMEGLHQPVIGFVGSLRNELDLKLLADAAMLAPEMTFVLVGPVIADVRPLAALRNVILVGPVPHSDVMAYMARFDIGILPYVLNDYTRHVMPMKFKEYLAAGLPVVSTRLPEVVTFAAGHPEAVTFAADAPAFVKALRIAVREDSNAAVARRVETAQQYDWVRQMASMSRSMSDALAVRERS